MGGSATIDVDRLGTWMDAQDLPEAGAPIEHRFISGGTQNDIYEIRRGDLHCALRIPPPEAPEPRDQGILREWRIIDALRGTDVPHTEAIAACDDRSVLGRAFYLMGFVDGWSPMGVDDWPAPFDTDLAARQGLAFELVDGIALLSGVDWKGKGLEDLGRPDGFHERQVERWTAFLERIRGRDLPGFEEAATWLRSHRPLEDGPGVGGRADGAAVAADEGLQGGGGVHVGHRHDPLDVGDGGQGVPGLLHLVEVGHVGHRAPGVEVGEDHLLVVGREHVGRLGHEVHAAEHDELGGLLLLGQHGQAVAVPPGVGPADDLVPLVVVAEDEHPLAEGRLGGADPGVQGIEGRQGVALVERLLESEHVVGSLHCWGVPVSDGGDSPVASPRGCRPRNRYVAGYRAGVISQRSAFARGNRS
jgi:hypothetical protein